MKSSICTMFGIEFPLIAFTHCRDVVVEVSKAGGMGVLGAAGHTTESLEIDLLWIDEHIGGNPYGVDLIAPTSMASATEGASLQDLTRMVPNEHQEYASKILSTHNISTDDIYTKRRRGASSFLTPDGAANIIDVAFAHPIKLIVNALGVPPAYMIEMGRSRGVATAALVGTKDHAIKQAEAGVDVIIASGTEAGGHCGEVSSMVLVPEVCDAVKEYGVPVLAAGGIVTGRQMAACMTMGAAGVWTGSMWLTTIEAETPQVIKEKYVAASSRDTVRSKARTGKFSRQLKSAWTDAWEAASAPSPLPMPLQSRVAEPALSKVNKLAAGGHEGAKELSTYCVGQGVGLMNSIQNTKAVVFDFKQDYLEAVERLNETIDE